MEDAVRRLKSSLNRHISRLKIHPVTESPTFLVCFREAEPFVSDPFRSRRPPPVPAVVDRRSRTVESSVRLGPEPGLAEPSERTARLRPSDDDRCITIKCM